MAAPSGLTTSIHTTLFWLDAPLSTASATTVKAAAVTANEITCVTNIGDVGDSANINDVTCYGESVTRQVAGPASQGSFEFTVALDRTNAVHQKLLGLTNGEKKAAIIQVKQGEGISWIYMQGQVASNSESFPSGSDVNSLTIGLARDEQPKKFVAS